MPANHIRALKDVQKRREAFEEIAKLLISYNQLSDSLEELVRSTTASNSVSDKAHQLLATLDENQRQMSVDKIEGRLENLDLSIRDDLSFFIDLADPKLKKLPSEESDLPTKVEQFKRKVRLSFAYRVLLCEHGEPLTPIELDVAPDLVSTAIGHLKTKEIETQGKLLSELEAFKSLAKSVAAHPEIPEPIRDELMFAEHQISENIAHLNAGQPITTVPSSFESINLDFSIMTLSENLAAAGMTEDEEPTETDDEDSNLTRSKSFLQRAKDWLDQPVQGTRKKRP